MTPFNEMILIILIVFNNHLFLQNEKFYFNFNNTYGVTVTVARPVTVNLSSDRSTYSSETNKRKK